MPRSPHRHSPPPPPLISHNMRGRLRSPDMRHYQISSRGRMPHDYRPVARRSQSPPLKRRSFSPPLKRKMSPPIREREPRRTKVSKASRDYEPEPMPSTSSRGDPDFMRNSAGRPDRYREKEYKEESDGAALPLFRGPENSINYDGDELKKLSVEIVRYHGGPSQSSKHINRSITNPDDITPVRRPGEGARPLFRNAEMAAASTSKAKEPVVDSDEYRRVVAMDSGRYPPGRPERGRSPPYYDEPKRPFYPEHREQREHSPYDRRSPPREFIESREKIRERRGSSKDDLRRDLDIKRRDERRYSPERPIYERESDLRKRIMEKRTDSFPRGEDREPPKRYEGEWEKNQRIRHSPPPRSFDHGFRPNREEGWKGRDNGSEWKGPPHGREREDRGRERFDDFDRDGSPPPYKDDFPPKKYFKNYEDKEFVPYTSRGRGSPSFRRGGGPPFIRGRGRSFRGGSSSMSRGPYRGAFRGSRGFHSRRPSF